VSQSKKKEKKSYFNQYNKLINDKSQFLNFIKCDMKGNQIEDYTTTNLSLFCEKKEDFLTLISNESKLNFACYIDMYVCMCVMITYIYIYIYIY